MSNTVTTTSNSSRRWVLPVSILGSSLGFIDTSVVNIALPTIQSQLGISLAGAQWVTNAYLLSLASLVLIGGAAGDRWGTLRVFVSGLVLFVLASIFCGAATAPGMLIAARLVQGAGAAFLMPASLALITENYNGEARARAIGTWAAAGGMLMAMGPPLGGWLVATIGWRSIFFINIPIASAAFGLSAIIANPWRKSGQKSLDLFGAILAIATLAALTYGLIVLGEGSTVRGGCLAAAGLVFGIAFVIVERRSPEPMIPLYLFRLRSFAGANALTVLLYGALGAAVFMLPYAMIRLHGYRSAVAGFAFMPLSLTFGLGSRFTGNLVGVLGSRMLLMTGTVLSAAGFAALALFADGSAYVIVFLPGLLLVGLGLTVAVPALTTVVFDSVSSADNGTASGINNAAARTGSLLATAALGIAFNASVGAEIPAQTLLSAYVTVMWCCAVAAMACVPIAASTVIGTRPDDGNAKGH